MSTVQLTDSELIMLTNYRDLNATDRRLLFKLIDHLLRLRFAKRSLTQVTEQFQLTDKARA